MGLRDIRTKARTELHHAMNAKRAGVPGPFYLANGVADPSPLAVTVRVHTRRNALGDMQGTSLNYAERFDVEPKLIFLRTEVPAPVKNGVVSVEPGEAYRITAVEPADGITVTCQAVRVENPTQLATLAALHAVP